MRDCFFFKNEATTKWTAILAKITENLDFLRLSSNEVLKKFWKTKSPLRRCFRQQGLICNLALGPLLALSNLLLTAVGEDIIGSNLFSLSLVAMSLTRLLPVAPWCCSASLSSSCSTIRARILFLALSWLWLVAPNLFLITPSLFATTNRTSHAFLAL